MKVFLDANILFSAAREGSAIAKLLTVITAYGQCVTNSYALTEAERNITNKRYGNLEVLRAILVNVRIDTTLASSVPLPIKGKDIPILAGAIGQSCTHLLTGDVRDFGMYFGETIDGVLILSPRMMAESLASRGLLELSGDTPKK